MDNISKDILSNICTFLSKKDVLNLKKIKKKFNRIITIYVSRHYYLKLEPIIEELSYFFYKSFSEPNCLNCPKIITYNDIMSKIGLINKISISNKRSNNFNYLYSMFSNVKNIKICHNQSSYNFLTSFRSLKKLELDTNHCISNKSTCPNLPMVKSLDIKCTINSINGILEKMPNIQKLSCTFLSIDIVKIPKIKCLKIRHNPTNFNNPVYSIISKCNPISDIIFDDLEKLIVDDIYAFEDVTINHNKNIIMPNLNSIIIKEIWDIQIDVYDDKGKTKRVLKMLKFDPAKISYLEFRCPNIMEFFLDIYPLKLFTKPVLVNLF